MDFFLLADEGKICKNVVKPPNFLSPIEVDEKTFPFSYIHKTNNLFRFTC